MRRVWSMAALVLLVPLASLAQTAPGAGPFRIAGIVVNDVTGAPVARATVAILTAEDNHAIAFTPSDAEGRFAFAHLAAGKFQLTASKRGFLTAAYEQHGFYSSAIVTGADQDTGNLVFRLAPAATLRGVVTADGGEAVEGADVLLLRKPQPGEPDEADKNIHLSGTFTTADDTGAYEFSNLAPGEYYVAVDARPWYAMHLAGDRSSPQSQAAAALDVVYPVTYFDSTTDEGSAAPLALTAGSREEADINLHAVPALYLHLELPHRQDGRPILPTIRQLVGGDPVPARGDYRAGSADFVGLAPGVYQVSQGDPPRVAELNFSSSGEIDPNAGTPTVAVSGTVESASGEALPDGALVMLQRLDDVHDRQMLHTMLERGRFSFPAVLPGTWEVQAHAAGTVSPVTAVATGGKRRAGNRIAVQDEPLSVSVVVSPTSLRVQGFARKNGEGSAGAMIVLVPRDVTQISELARRDQSDSDGSFNLLNVAPGAYTVIAIENAWDQDWTQPDFLARYLGKGVALNVAANSSQIVRLSAPVDVQMR